MVSYAAGGRKGRQGKGREGSLLRNESKAIAKSPELHARVGVIDRFRRRRQGEQRDIRTRRGDEGDVHHDEESESSQEEDEPQQIEQPGPWETVLSPRIPWLGTGRGLGDWSCRHGGLSFLRRAELIVV